MRDKEGERSLYNKIWETKGIAGDVIARAYLHVVGEEPWEQESKMPALMAELGYEKTQPEEIPEPWEGATITRPSELGGDTITVGNQWYILEPKSIVSKPTCSCAISAFGKAYDPACPECDS